MKVCCDSGKLYTEQTDIEKLGYYSTDHCAGPIEVEEYDVRDNIDLLLTGLGTFDTKDCISHEDLRHLFNKSGSWQEWIVSQIKQEGVEKYKQWYARMFEKGAVCSELIDAHNKLFNGEMN